jgi:hypothetical protein
MVHRRNRLGSRVDSLAGRMMKALIEMIMITTGALKAAYGGKAAR